MRRADRLFSLLLELRRGRVVTARRLAERLSVSERTIYRDVADLQRFIADAKSELATLTNMVQTGLELRFGEAAKAQLRASGRDTGTVHLEDDGFDIGVDVDKTVAWDQNDLSAKWDRIGASGDNPRQYITAKFSVSETRYKAWPEVLRQQFESARTVTPGKPKFTVSRIGEGK